MKSFETYFLLCNLLHIWNNYIRCYNFSGFRKEQLVYKNGKVDLTLILLTRMGDYLKFGKTNFKWIPQTEDDSVQNAI